jgi:isopenicillin-N N-acyltransferase like protein
MFDVLRLSSLIALAMLVAGSAPAAELASRTFTERKIEGAELRYVGNVPVATFTGNPEEIGRQHAELLGEFGKQAMSFPKRFAAEFGIEALWPFMAKAGRTLILKTPERHQHELSAIALDSPFGEDELAVANTLLELRRVGCSAIIVEPARSSTGGPLFGRNFDFPTLGELHKYSLLMVYRPTGRRAFASVGFPGLVGAFSGMNDAGLAVATLDVYRSADKSRKFNSAGTPLAFVFRRILEECATVDEAEQLLKSEQPTTWMNLAVCDRRSGAVFEITPDRIGRRDDEAGVVRCTNHFRVDGLTVNESCGRYDALDAGDDAAPIGLKDVQAKLDAANQGEMTFQTMIFQPRELVVHLALGAPPVSGDPLTRIDLRPLLNIDSEQTPAAETASVRAAAPACCKQCCRRCCRSKRR